MTDDGAQTSLYEPQTRTMLTEPSTAREMAQDLPLMLTLLKRNYECHVIGRERVNNCLCAVVALRARDADGPCKLLWIDVDHPYVLRLEEHDVSGIRQYVSSYDSITFPAHLPPASLTPPPAAKSAVRRTVQALSYPRSAGTAKAFAAAGLMPLTPAWTPKGYTLLRVTLLTQPDTGEKMVQMRYSDGLKTLTVLQSHASTTLPTPAALNGALARYGQQAWAQNAGRVQTVVRGDLSMPDSVGRGMLLALMPQSESRLLRGLAQDFGPGARSDAPGLRRAGWDYVQIASLLIYLHLSPQNAPRVRALIARKCAWTEIARRLRTDSGHLDTRARLWIAGTLGQEKSP